MVHVSHAAGRSALLFFRNVGDEGFGGQHQRRDRAGVLQSGAHHLGRVEHACLDQVFVLAGQGVIAEVVVLRVVDLAQTDREFSCLDAILDHKREGHQGARCPVD